MTRLPSFTAGDALIVVGVLHTAIGFAEYRRTSREMARDGMVGTVDGDHERGEAFWFLVCGASMVLTGRLARWAQLRTGTLPASAGSLVSAWREPSSCLVRDSGPCLSRPSWPWMPDTERVKTGADDASVEKLSA